MILLEILISLVAWTVQIGMLILIATSLWIMLSELSPLRKVVQKKQMTGWNGIQGQILSILLVFLLAAGLALHPPVICVKSTDVKLTDEMRQEITGFNSGLYSWRLPLIPVYIEVLEYDGQTARVRTHYFIMGNIEMQIGWDGPSIVKPLV